MTFFSRRPYIFPDFSLSLLSEMRCITYTCMALSSRLKTPLSSRENLHFRTKNSLLTLFYSLRTMGVDRRVDRGTSPPYFLGLGGQSMLCPPYFLNRICLFLRLCVCNFFYNCYLAKTVNQSRAKSSLLRLIMSLGRCPYR